MLRCAQPRSVAAVSHGRDSMRALQRPKRCICRRANTEGTGSSSQQAQTPHPPATISFKKVLVAVLDGNPYLGGGSRQALATAAALSRQSPDGGVTVLVLDGPNVSAESTKIKMDTVSWHLRDQNSAPFEVMEAARDASTSPAALIGDMVDQVEADVLVLSSEVVHAKAVDANLLAEFVSCPLLLLP